MPSKNTWEKTDRLAEHLTYGEPTIEQISESEAKKAFPEAFQTGQTYNKMQ